MTGDVEQERPCFGCGSVAEPCRCHEPDRFGDWLFGAAMVLNLAMIAILAVQVIQ